MTRATRGGRARTSAGSPDAGQHGGSPRPRRKQPHNSRSSQTPGNISDVSTAIVSHTAQRLPPVMAMPPEARSVWNLKILRRHDPLISRIFDQAPYGVLYTFNHAHAHEPDGGKGRKYEGTWEKTGIEGTVFLVERFVVPSRFAHHSSWRPVGTLRRNMDSSCSIEAELPVFFKCYIRRILWSSALTLNS